MYLAKPKHILPIVAGLAALMLATRFHHFGSPVSLPDASWAVFFLSGFYLRPMVMFPLFLAEAALIDYAAIANGVSDWCITPAYGFLIPTYGSLWLAGRWYAGRACAAWRTLVPLTGALLTGTSVAFLISNGSFYLLSGYFTELGWGNYAMRVAKYFPLYFASTFIYVMLAACAPIIAGAFKPGRAVSPTRGPQLNPHG
jgi:hypothetical protein